MVNRARHWISGLKYRLVIFDMDGTLADSFPWIVRVVNDVADKYRFRRVTPEDVEKLRGYDARRILDALEVPSWKLPLIARHMRALKAQHMQDIPLFPGVARVLSALVEHGIALGIVSSDSEANVRRALGDENAHLVGYFACGASLFGKAAKFKTVLRRSGVRASEALAIGDEIRDAEAARHAGIAFGAVTWGYASVEALQVCSPAETFATMEDIAAKLVA
jgi:phosphoglycolate phosphatase